MSNCMIGILAGMGPKSTAPFIDAVVDQCQKLYGAKLDQEFPLMMILSLPTPFYIDRPIDHHVMRETIVRGLRKLESTGVDFIAMPCNSAHLYYDELAASIKVPLINSISETLAMLNRTGRITLLCTQGTFDSGIYQEGFERANLEFHFHREWQARVNQIISLIKAGEIMEKGVTHWKELLRDLKGSKIEQAVIACTDLNAILPFSDNHIAFVDSMEALARATVRKYLEISG